MLHKIWIVLRSEYWRRVRSKAFILTTLLLPFGLAVLMIAPGIVGYYASQSDETRVAVVDETGMLFDRLQQTSGTQFVFSQPEAPLDSVRVWVRAGRFDGFLLLPDSLLDGQGRATYISDQGGGMVARAQLEGLVEDVVQDARLGQQNTPPEVLAILESDVTFATRKLTDQGTAAGDFIASMAIGWAMAFLIYLTVIIYGQYVMQGVIEEKNSRAVEIVVSSVRPFELMMGKVLGIGAMGLTQLVVWGMLVLGGVSALGSVAALLLDPSTIDLPAGATEEVARQVASFALPSLSPGLFIWFVLFFLGGYLLYASLFAAVGSAVEQQQDAQSLILPIILPLIVPIGLLYVLLETPNATLSVVMSIIPFFSPVLMVARIAVTSVPTWQLALSFALLVSTFVGAIWVCGRIYRVGILMYGKKPSLRELLRWTTY